MSDDAAEYELGPKMRALTDRQRAFVRGYIGNPLAPKWVLAKRAGYGGPKVSGLSLRVTANQVMSSARVVAAIHEETLKQVKLGAAIGVAGLIRLASDPKAKGHLQACQALADRGGIVAAQEINVNHNHTDMTGAAMLERIRALAVKHGLDPEKLLGAALPAPKVIEHDPAA